MTQTKYDSSFLFANEVFKVEIKTYGGRKVFKQEIPIEDKKAMYQLFKYLKEKFGINVVDIMKHKDSKDCIWNNEQTEEQINWGI